VGYIELESDLRLISRGNILFDFKYADHANVLVSEITNVCLADEFENVKKWASYNKMIISLNKTKEIVFLRPNPRHCLHPDPLAYIDQVHEIRLHGLDLTTAWFLTLMFYNVMLRCARRFCLMKSHR
jgi:hypothetical protein